jgi:formylglycine-generating enzyme required for sulfatase activity
MTSLSPRDSMGLRTSRNSGKADSKCLSDEVLEDLIDGRLPDDALAQAHRHAAECNDCRLLLVELSHGGVDRLEKAQPATPQVGHSELTQGVSWTPPVEFDEFRIERLIGRGGMGVVYLAHDTSLGRRVAVKFIALSQPEPWVLESFKSEARMLARLQHPNVVNVFSVGEVQGHPYIVSEYVVGQSLAELPLPMSWRRVLTLGVELAQGLAAAHRQGVLHRDLKPSNALVTEKGEVKLLDFGLAERFEPGASSASSGSLAGTPAYMAPELLGRAPATPRSDIYSLGLVLRELCTGQVPSRTPRPPEESQAPLGLGQDVDPDFAAIIAQCLAPNPLERFASAEVLCEALKRVQGTLPARLVHGNPYRGLAPFEAEHRELFFGRKADIHAVLERIHHRPLVLVAGDSGAGKSSLCRAGVLPRVAAGGLEDACERATITLWPGLRPLESLAAALAPVLGRKEAELVTALADPKPWLGQALREAYQGGRGLLLFIDQLEELITLSEPAQAAHFARILGEFALPSAGVRVLLAVRGDFLTRLCALPGLGEEAERALYILRPMTPEGVREAIVGPARRYEVVFESEQLIRTLVASAAHGVGSLPLLQFALAELWEQRNPALGRITQAALDEMGGVAGALSRHADGLLARLSSAEREAARRLLLQLVTVEGTRIERSEEELVSSSGSDAASVGACRAALRALIEGRLLHTRTANGQPRCEIAHDSLIQSWGTLREWLDDDIGHRAVIKRVQVASAEWERFKHAREALWGPRQLDEVRPLEDFPWEGRERAFLHASRRAVARQRWGRLLAVLGVSLTAAASYGGLRLQAHLADARFVAAQLVTARQLLSESRGLAQRASVRRDEVLALFDATAPDGWESLEQPWGEALTLRNEAETAYAHANQALERALDRDRGNVNTRQLLAETTYERVGLAELFHQQDKREELRERLELVSDTGGEGAQWLQQLQAPAEFDLVTEPPGAAVELERYTDRRGTLRREPVALAGSLNPTPLSRVTLPEGSYLLHVSQPGHTPVELPLLLTHGAREQLRLTLPTAVPEGYVYIPPGCFLLGSAEAEKVRQVLRSPPIHRFCLSEGFLIGKTEVTFGDWLAYLDSLPPDAPARRILEQPNFSDFGAIALRQQPGAGWSFSFYLSRTVSSTAKEAEPFLYPGSTRRKPADWRRFPLSGVSARDLEDYFSWLDRTKLLPGARLCNQHEWEYAVRGADGRLFPHGNQLQPDEANIDATYNPNRQTTDFGPDMVGSYPASVSPFGLLDMAGNAYELTRAVAPESKSVFYRGGSWHHDVFSAYSTNITVGEPGQRETTLGVRMCASFSPR